ncbi:hypothetical protein JJC03_09110 [Flavobacterium oreochromis]|uniref:hypothetical protein n=1 Tax=Flavobacterium oreochromis TaxID=2906078 RepID=UPI001CE6897B|nr:hypothetical protein [Flavobacterium oreochromis]QYS85397.1 hypothetical protein JJC03_09110 [Flavobacterium oreochromis]
MKKYILLLFLILVNSCGIIKKNKAFFKEKTKVELIENKNVKQTELDTSKVFEPVDVTKPMVVNGDTIYNTRVVNNYKTIHTIVRDSIHLIKDDQKKEVVKEKETDNTTVYLYLFGFVFLFLFAVIVFLIVYYGKK